MKRTLQCLIGAVTVSLILWLWGLLAFAQVDDPNPPPEPRSLASSAVDVSASGAFTTSLAVALPAARGPVPSIGLNYSSARANGLAGVGWHLSGFPAIVRARDTGMNFNTLDKFVFLPGGWGTSEDRDNRLVNSSGNYYRTKVRAGSPPDQFRPSAQSCGSGPCYWEMRDGSGTRYYFGGDASSHPGLHAPGAWHAALWEPYNGVTQNRGIVAWPIYKIVVPDGNYLKVTYNENDRTFWPARVEYNLPQVGASGRAMAVTFEYETRPDVTRMPAYFAVRIKNIRVYGNWQSASRSGTLIRRYQLTYGASPISGLSRLISFQAFGSDGDNGNPPPVGLEATTFTFTNSVDYPFSTSHPVDAGPSPGADGLGRTCVPGQDPAGCLWNTFLGDLNADGKADLVRTYYGNYGGRVHYRCGGVDGFPTGSTAVVHTSALGAQWTYLTAMGDFDGDGRQDIVAIYPDPSTSKLITAIAYGGHSNGSCSLGPWVAQPDQTVTDVTMSSSPFDWRISVADLDGDGRNDVVLYDKANNVLYWKMYWAGQLSARQAGRYRAGYEWASCNQGYPNPRDINFNGVEITDYNGDGKADVMASWSRNGANNPSPEASFPGMISVLMATGSATGLNTPCEICHTPATSYPTPAIRYPHTVMRQGDINGDGIDDVTLSYQGKRWSTATFVGVGYAHGRDVRYRLGTTSPGGSDILVQSTSESDYPHPCIEFPLVSASCGSTGQRRNHWEYATGDINGDGIDEYIQSYLGAQGNKLYYAIGTPIGPGTLFAHVDSATASQDGVNVDYPKFTLAIGDFNGDGIKDVARVRLGSSSTSPATWVGLYWGTAGGLSSTVENLGFRDIGGGDARALRVMVADINGDARDDLFFVNDNIEFGGTFTSSLSIGTSDADNTGLPDLLTSVNNGVLGTTSVYYRLARDFTDAIKPEWPNQCTGGNGTTVTDITGAICGRIDSRPRALVREIHKDHGISRNSVNFKERFRYDYTNGRVYGGAIAERADLGFSNIITTNPDTNASIWSRYRQDKPFERNLDTSTLYAPGSVAQRRVRNVYTQGPPPVISVTAVHHTDSYLCAFETGLALPCAHQNMTYDPSSLVLLQLRDGTEDIPGERDIYTNFAYSLDSTNWVFRPLSSWTHRQNSSGTNIVLDMRRITYDTAAGKTTHVLKRERILFDDAETANCASIGDPWNASTCSDKISSGAAHWVTTFTTNSANYDAQGNLTWFGSYPVSRDSPNPPWEHPVTLAYDVTYKGLVSSVTNALNQTTTFTYDVAGRLLTTTDPNNKTWTYTYDVHGRPSTHAPPGVGLYQTRWEYPGVDPVRGYQVDEFTYVNATTSHRSSIYVDGFGGLAQTRDYSGLAGGTIDTLNQDIYISNQRVRRESWPYFISRPIAKFIETTFDDRGRPLTIKRVNNNASFSIDYHASGQPAIRRFSYNNPDGLHSVTTAIDGNGSVRSSYWNYRGLVTKIVDDAGTTTLSYSTGLRLAQVTLPSTTYNTVAYTYDSWGRLKTENDPNGEGIVAYIYDDAGMLTDKLYYRSAAMTTPTRRIHYNYDQLDRLKAGTNGFFTTHVTYTYDETTPTNGIGRLTRVTDGPGTTQFNFDGRGNVTSQIITLNGLSGSTTYSYAYDDRDLVTGMAFPDAVQKVTYTVDGVLTAVTHNGVSWGIWTNFDVFKRAKTFQAYDNGGWTNVTNYRFDVDQRLSRIVQRQKDGSVVQDLSYAYDAVGNVKTITDNRPTKTINGINTDLTQSFAYDPLNRLCATRSTFLAAGTCTTTSPAPSATFTYDGIGNLLTDSGTTNTYYTRIGSERVIENRTPLTIGIPSFVSTGTETGQTILNWRAYHDSEGKRTRFEDCSVSPCVNYSYGYDYRGRLTSVTQDGVVRESYAYDFTDRRTKKSYNNRNNTAHAWFFGPSYTVRKNSVDMARTAKTLSIAGIATHTYGDKIPGAVSAATVDSNINQPFTSDTDQAVPLGIYLRQPDLLGSLTAMTRASDGAAVARNRYDAWGDHLAADSLGQDTSYEKFTGQPHEDFSGLAYYGSRYYHPKTRRFITPDDRIVGGGAQGYNRFAYVRNNPATYIDPTGHQETGPTTSQHCYPPPCNDDGSGGSGGAVSLGNPFDLFKELSGGGQSSGGQSRQSRQSTVGPETRSYAKLQLGRRTAEAHQRASDALTIWKVAFDHEGDWDRIAGFLNDQRIEELFSRWGEWETYNEVRRAYNVASQVTQVIVGYRLLQPLAEAVASAAAAPGIVPGATNRIYSARVLLRSAEEPGPLHNFPGSFDAQIFRSGVGRWYGDNYFQYELRGSINGRTGTFEIGVRPSASGRTEVIVHRFFRPDPR